MVWTLIVREKIRRPPKKDDVPAYSVVNGFSTKTCYEDQRKTAVV